MSVVISSNLHKNGHWISRTMKRPFWVTDSCRTNFFQRLWNFILRYGILGFSEMSCNLVLIDIAWGLVHFSPLWVERMAVRGVGRLLKYIDVRFFLACKFELCCGNVMECCLPLYLGTPQTKIMKIATLRLTTSCSFFIVYGICYSSCYQYCNKSWYNYDLRNSFHSKKILNLNSQLSGLNLMNVWNILSTSKVNNTWIIENTYRYL